VESISAVFEVSGVESGNGDTAVHGHVDGVLFAELVNLVGRESSVGKHADLVSNMGPVVLVSAGLEGSDEAGSHGVHAAGHILQVLVPHGGKLIVTKDDVDNTGTVDGRVGVDGSGNLLNAGLHEVGLLFATSNNGEAASALTVDTEVLSERLEEHNIVSVLGEETERVGVLLEVTRGEALVGRVETAEKVFGLDNIHNFVPLLRGGVNTGGVVSTDVEEHDRFVLHGLHVLEHALEIESLGLLVVVTVVVPLETGEFGEVAMEGPGGVRHVDINIFVGVPVAHKSETEAEGASSGNRLSAGNTVFLDGLGVTEGKDLRLFDEAVDTLDARVFVIHLVGENSLFSELDALEDEGLALVVTVSTHAEENLLAVGVLLEGFVEAENGVGRGGGNVGPGAESAGLGDLGLLDESFGKHINYYT